jgi:hypothetical protein
LRSGKKEEKTFSFWPDDLEWLAGEAERRSAYRSDILAELIAEARGRAADGDLIEMLVKRLEAVEQHTKAIRATVGTEVQLAFMPEERRPRTWADRKELIERMAERLGGNGS